MKPSLLYIFLIVLFHSAYFPMIKTIAGENSPKNQTLHSLFNLDQEDAEELLNQINISLRTDPEDIGLNVLRAKVYYRLKKYTMAEKIFLQIKNYITFDSGLNYLLSRLYCSIDSLNKSAFYFAQITSTNSVDSLFMDDFEKDATFFFTRDEKEEYESAEDKLDYIKKYWVLNDNRPETLGNEYYKQMLDRLDYCYENFTDGFAFDERGKIYLRYGAPAVMRRFEHQGFKTECWMYNDLAREVFSFDFIFQIRQPYWKLITRMEELLEPFSKSMNSDTETFKTRKRELAYRDDIPSMSFFEDRHLLSNRYSETFAEIESVPEKMGDEPGIKLRNEKQDLRIAETHFVHETNIKAQLPEVVADRVAKVFPLQTKYYRFFNHDDLIDVIAAYGMPLGMLDESLFTNINSEINLVEKHILKDRDFRLIARHKEIIPFLFEDVNTSHFIDQVEFTFPPDRYFYSISLEDKDSNFTAANTCEFKLDDFLKQDLFISDILLSNYIIANEKSPEKYLRNGFEIHAYPYDDFYKHSDMFLYFEIYNLSLAHGFTNYRVEWGFYETDDEADLNEGEVVSIEFKQNYNGSKQTDFLMQQIDTSELEEGDYILKITVTDTNNNKSFERIKKINLLD